MSFCDLYLSGSPLLGRPGGGGEPAAIVFGAPFDSTHSYRPGARFGPDAIRGAFHNIEVFRPDVGVDLEGERIEDLGNLRHTVDAGAMLEMVGRVAGELAGRGPPVVVLGGEHLVTLGSLGAFPRGAAYVVFDAHYDLRDGYADAGLSHASYLRRAVESRGPEGVLHVGARAFSAEEAAFLAGSGISTVSDAQVRDGLGPRMVADFLSSYDSVYASFDLDVADPAFAPGVGNPEPEGLTSREIFGMVRALGETRVAGADVVELCPPHDNGAAAAMAARIVSYVAAFGASRR